MVLRKERQRMVMLLVVIQGGSRRRCFPHRVQAKVLSPPCLHRPPLHQSDDRDELQWEGL